MTKPGSVVAAVVTPERKLNLIRYTRNDNNFTVLEDLVWATNYQIKLNPTHNYQLSSQQFTEWCEHLLLST